MECKHHFVNNLGGHNPTFCGKCGYAPEQVPCAMWLVKNGKATMDAYLLEKWKDAKAYPPRDNEPMHYPKPEYCFCNAGHPLSEVFDEKRNAFVWDCPTCAQRMNEADKHYNGEKCQHCKTGYYDYDFAERKFICIDCGKEAGA